MSGNGWISLHRSLQNHWLFTEKRKFSKFEAWVDLLLLMNHADAKTLFREELIHIKRGQHVTSIRKLGDRWGWSKTKIDNFLTLLEEEGMIKTKKDSKKTLVTVVNYDFYQSDNFKKGQYQNQNENKIPEKKDSEETVTTQVNQQIQESDVEEVGHRKDSERTVKSTNNNVNNENNLNNLINNNNESPNSWLDDFEAEFASSEGKRKLMDEIESYFRARRGEDPNKPTTKKNLDLIKIAVGKYSKEEIIDGMNHAFLTSEDVYSFQYCLDCMDTQKKDREKQHKQQHQKKVVPFNKQKKTNNPARQLPESIRKAQEQDQQLEVEKKLSPEEEAQFRANMLAKLENMRKKAQANRTGAMNE